MRRPLLRLLPFLPLLFPGVRADTLVLQNGDRLTGRTVSVESDTIQFNSDVLGLISISPEKARVEAEAAPAPQLEAIVRPQPAPKPAAKPLDFSSVDFRMAARDPKRAQWKEDSGWLRKLEFGFSGQRNGTSRTDFSMRFEVARRGPTSEGRLQLRHLYGKTDGITSTDNSNVNLRLRKNLSEVLFGQSTTNYDRDGVRGVRYSVQQGLGLGRNIVSSDDMVVAMGAGAALRKRALQLQPAELSYLVDAFQDLTYRINDHVSLRQDMAMLFAPADGDDYRINFNAAVNTRLTADLELSMRYEFEYDRAVTARERQSQRLVTSLGVAF